MFPIVSEHQWSADCQSRNLRTEKFQISQSVSKWSHADPRLHWTGGETGEIKCRRKPIEDFALVYHEPDQSGEIKASDSSPKSVHQTGRCPWNWTILWDCWWPASSSTPSGTGNSNTCRTELHRVSWLSRIPFEIHTTNENILTFAARDSSASVHENNRCEYRISSVLNIRFRTGEPAYFKISSLFTAESGWSAQIWGQYMLCLLSFLHYTPRAMDRMVGLFSLWERAWTMSKRGISPFPLAVSAKRMQSCLSSIEIGYRSG